MRIQIYAMDTLNARKDVNVMRYRLPPCLSVGSRSEQFPTASRRIAKQTWALGTRLGNSPWELAVGIRPGNSPWDHRRRNSEWLSGSRPSNGRL